MNERLWELAEQSVVTMDIETRADRRRADRIDIRKFAELIVGECIRQCYKVQNEMDGATGDGAELCYEAIKQHFGVEE